jgi:hypothetical protein
VSKKGLKIYRGTEANNVTQLKLTEGGDGKIYLDGLDDRGNLVAILAVIEEDGRLLIPNKILANTGLAVDNFGRIKTSSLGVKANPGRLNRRFFNH